MLGAACIIWALDNSDTLDCELYNGVGDINTSPDLGVTSKPLNAGSILWDGEPSLPCPNPKG